MSQNSSPCDTLSHTDYTLTAGQYDEGRRLDRIIRKLLSTHRLSEIYVAIRTGHIRVNHTQTRCHYRVRKGDQITIDTTVTNGAIQEDAAPHADRADRTKKSPHSRTDIRTNSRTHSHHDTESPTILFHNQHLIAIIKPAGMKMFGEDSCSDWVTTMAPHPHRPALGFQRSALHRLDRNTSGIVLFSASLRGAQKISQLLQERRLKKGYMALFQNHLEGECEWHDMLWRDDAARRTVVIRGNEKMMPPDTAPPQEASLHIMPLLHGETNGTPCTLALCRMKSGRTHQIRAQSAFHGYPLVGDVKYGGYPRHRYMLHAASLSIDTAQDDPAATLGFQNLSAPLPSSQWKIIAPIFGAAHVRRVCGTFL